jgi:hypothetical protein
MSITWPEIAKGVISLAGVAVVGWAGWLSVTMVDVKTQVSGIDSKLVGVGERVARISERLPTEIALHTQELYGRRIKTAVISGKAQFQNGVWTRYVAVFDQENELIRTFPFPVSNPADDDWLHRLLWTVGSHDESSVRFSVLEKYRQLYNIEIPAVPEFVDADNSVITSKRFDEVLRKVDDQYQERLSVRQNVPKPSVKHLSQETITFQDLAKELIYHETAFKP